MFEKRPTNPKGTMIIGVVAAVIGVIALPFALLDPFETTARGFPLLLVVAVILLAAAYYLTWGVIWLRRDRGQDQ